MLAVHPASREAEVLDRLVAAVGRGIASRAMQAVPHLSLLSDDFYQAELRPPLCAWLVLWMRRQGLRELDDAALRACLDGGGADEAAQCLPDSQIKMLNLGASWLGSLLPHCLHKVNRVHYGLLRPHEIARMSALNTLPRSRRYLAVPFVGKDAPSAASEYAHPDIGIGLTYLAYRYEGLRRTDFGGCLQHMRATLQAEIYGRYMGDTGEI